MPEFKSKTGEPVAEEKWQWFVNYSDGTALAQFDYATGEYHVFADIDQSKVVKLNLFNRESNKILSIDIESNVKLIHFYENIIQQPLGGTAIHHRLYCIGYEKDGEKHIWTMLPNDMFVKAAPENIGVL